MPAPTISARRTRCRGSRKPKHRLHGPLNSPYKDKAVEHAQQQVNTEAFDRELVIQAVHHERDHTGDRKFRDQPANRRCGKGVFRAGAWIFMHEFMSRFSMIHRQSSAYLNRHLKQHGITASRYTYILIICATPGVSQEEIAGRLKINKGSMARAIQQFEADGHVTRCTAAGDKRQYRVHPTEKARALYENIHGIAMDVENRLPTEFTKIEWEILLHLLDNVVLNLGK